MPKLIDTAGNAISYLRGRFGDLKSSGSANGSSSTEDEHSDTDQQANLDSEERPERHSRGNVIGLIVPDITNPFFAHLAKNIEMEAASRGGMVMLANSHDDPDIERKQVRAMHDWPVTGVIVVAVSDASRPYEASIPVISLDRRYGSYPLVATDQRDGGRKAAEHLYELGHRTIAYIAGPETMEVARERRDGFVDQINKLSSPEDPINLTLHSGDFAFAAGETIARGIFLNVRKGDRTTAIATASDQQAIGVLRCARDLGIHVPQDVSVVGFDDITLASLVVPRLTTLRQPIEAIASRAVDQVLAKTQQKTDYAIRGSLIIRESSAQASRWE
ncbi:substrate-binding domain-containing protein [Roseibium sp.]|uniref:substrate-binding domain-containing protein n=1 Tax=Roseibium sp. TaxID=1936156 RepID=UPI003B5167E0